MTPPSISETAPVSAGTGRAKAHGGTLPRFTPIFGTPPRQRDRSRMGRLVSALALVSHLRDRVAQLTQERDTARRHGRQNRAERDEARAYARWLEDRVAEYAARGRG